ncbi:MAG: hypothetical protein LIO71_00935 [Ruminococcus sp.]|nr:hypothetical protein [Ruminococcus sp.]
MKNSSKLVYTVIVASVLFFEGCNISRTADINLGDSYTEVTSTTTTTPVVTTKEVTTTKELTLQEKLQNTCWVGASGTRNIMSFTFTDNTITVSNLLSSGFQEPDITGYWEVDDQKITVYSDINLTEMVTYYDYTLHEFENGDKFLYMESMYLSLMDSPTIDFNSICEDLAQSFSDISTVTDGGFWVGTNDANVDFFVCNYGDIYLYLASKDTSETSYFDGKWGLTYDSFYIVDNESSEFIYFNWQFDTDTSILTLIDSDGTDMEFTLTDADGFSSVMAIVNAHLDGTYEEVTTTTEETTSEETTTEETTENPYETSTEYNSEDNNYFFTNDNQEVNPDDSNYDDSKEYYDNYVKPVTTTVTYQYETEYYQSDTTYAYDYGYNSTDYDYNYGY